MQLTQWGTNKWLSFNYAFSGCENLHILATDSATANTGSAADFHAAWYNCHGMTSFPLLNTAAATNFNQTWFHCSGLTSFPALNAALVANFSQAWYNCTGLTSFPLLDTSSATSLYDAWGGCTALASFPALNTPLVADFSYAWAGCTGLNGYDFPTLNMGAMTNGAQCFNGVTLSTASYSALLVSIDALNARTHVTFSGGLSEYDAGAVTARGDLTATKLWTVTDGGLAP
jgi:hypothetical protein